VDSIGNLLKEKREFKNLSLEEVSKSTRIKEHFLKAIEEDRFNLCPSPFYVKGFLTNYARFLGLDPKDIILTYQKLITPPPSPEVNLQDLPNKTWRFQTRTASRLLLVSALFIALLIPLYFYLVYQRLKSPDPRSSISLRSAIPEAVQEKENRPVIDQIKQMELIGPKEVQADPLYEVLDAHLGTGIETEAGRPVVIGKGSEFKCENQRVYFFTRILSPKEGKIFHVWRRDGEESHRIEMSVKPPAWSVYSYISLSPARSGNWKVEVWDGDKMLGNSSFKAHPSSGPSSPP